MSRAGVLGTTDAPRRLQSPYNGTGSMFSSDYFEARERFRRASQRLGWSTTAYTLRGTREDAADLTIDVSMSDSDEKKHSPLLVVSSGLHGIEGIFGSAVQLSVLDRWMERGVPAGVRCVMIHALNPYGFVSSRRVDADNVDPNRNFLLPAEVFGGSPQAYGYLDDFLNRRAPPSRSDLFYVRAALLLMRYGKAALKDAIVGGQYDYDKGLFFGGKSSSPTTEIIQAHMKSWIGEPSFVVHLDYHTGLGRWGAYKLLVDDTLLPSQRAWLAQTVGTDFVEVNDEQGLAYRSRGGFGRWCTAQHFARDYRFAYAEFGTYSNLRVLAGLRAENQAHHWGGPTDDSTTTAKARLRELFCPASHRWRSMALHNGVGLIDRVVQKMRARSPRARHTSSNS